MLRSCVNDLVVQLEDPHAEADWGLTHTEQLKRFAAASEYRLLFVNLLRLIRSDQPHFQESDLSLEYLEEKSGSYLFRQAAQALSGRRRLSIHKAKIMLRRAVVLHRHGQRLLAQLEAGEVSVADVDEAASRIQTVQAPEVDSQDELDTEGYEEVCREVEQARQLLAEDLADAAVDAESENDFKRRARQLREERHPLSFEERARKARTHRSVKITPCPDGMSRIEAYVPSHTAVILERVFATIIRSMIADGSASQRSRNQLMADIFTDLLTKNPHLTTMLQVAERKLGDAVENGEDQAEIAGSTGLTDEVTGEIGSLPAGVGTHVVINMTLGQFIRLGGVADEDLLETMSEVEPELKGQALENIRNATLNRKNRREAIRNRQLTEQTRVVGSEHQLTPVDAAELIAELSRMSLVLTDTAQGIPLGVGRKTYRASEKLKLLTALRDDHCRAPGCRKPYFESELDHVHQWGRDRGGTDYGNLVYLCREHHTHKSSGWLNVEPRPDLGDGALEFSNPYTDGSQISQPRYPVHPAIWERHKEYLSVSSSPPF